MSDKKSDAKFFDQFLCPVMGETLDRHLQTCRACQEKLIEQFAVIEDIPLFGKQIRKKLGGVSLREHFQKNIWKETKQ